CFVPESANLLRDDFCSRRTAGIDAEVAYHKFGAGTCQTVRLHSADAASCTGDDGHLSVQSPWVHRWSCRASKGSPARTVIGSERRLQMGTRRSSSLPGMFATLVLTH